MQCGNGSIKFQGVLLKNLPAENIDPSDLSSLPNSILKAMKTAVMMTVDGMKQRFSTMLGEIDEDATGPPKIVACFRIFHHDVWPDDRGSLSDYGEPELKHLTTWFSPVLERFVGSTV